MQRMALLQEDDCSAGQAVPVGLKTLERLIPNQAEFNSVVRLVRRLLSFKADRRGSVDQALHDNFLQQ